VNTSKVEGVRCRLTTARIAVDMTKPAATTRGEISPTTIQCLSYLSALTRPCGHCQKKGLSVEQCVYGCEACRQARACCEGGLPCVRCMSMHLNCVDGTTSPLAALHVPGNFGGRVQLACKNCRRDNKKVEYPWNNGRLIDPITDGRISLPV
jgi:hypothetical protein